jgi:hypothetical protein
MRGSKGTMSTCTLAKSPLLGSRLYCRSDGLTLHGAALRARRIAPDHRLLLVLREHDN